MTNAQAAAQNRKQANELADLARRSGHKASRAALRSKVDVHLLVALRLEQLPPASRFIPDHEQWLPEDFQAGA